MRVGVGIKMAKARTVYRRKIKWKLDEPDDDTKPEWANNYISAKDRPDVLEKQFEEDIAEGKMMRISIQEARKEMGR